MKFNWAIKAINNGKTVNRKADKTTKHISANKKGGIIRTYKNGTVKDARFTADSIQSDDWYEVKT